MSSPTDAAGRRASARRGSPLSDPPGPPAWLDAAIAAGSALGLSVDAAVATRTTWAERLGLGSDVYALALAGGTGVGKSTLINALAGTEVSPSGVRRPTTAVPIAWTGRAGTDGTGRLLAWLGIPSVTSASDGRLGLPLVVVDLPDLDSVEPAHRATVDRLLPRLDAVLWVVDPEKYADAILHDAYMDRWRRRFATQAVVLNKADRLADVDLRRIRADIGSLLSRAGLPDVPVLAASALNGSAGIREVAAWVSAAADAKRVVADRLLAAARDAVESLAAEAGASGTAPPAPLVTCEEREALDAGLRADLVAALDPDGLRAQAVAAARRSARARGGGPASLLTARLYRMSGRERSVADPARYLGRWRARSGLHRPADRIEALAAAAAARSPVALRPIVAGSLEGRAAGSELGDRLDAVAARLRSRSVPPASAAWTVIGAAQYAVSAALLFSVLWLIALWLVHAPAPGSLQVPIIGPLPWPFALLVGSLVAGYLLARVLSWDAGRVGRRWADRLVRDAADEVASALEPSPLQRLEAIERARTNLWRAAEAARA